MKRNFLRLGALVAFVAIVAPAPVHAAGFGSGMVEFAIKELCKYMIGDLGGLLTAVAGFGAIVAAAFGAYRAFYSAIITAIGAFTISSIMSIYFEGAASTCDGAAKASRTATAATPRTADALERSDDFFNFDVNAVGEDTGSAGPGAAKQSGIPEVQDRRAGWKGVDPFNEHEEVEAADSLVRF